MDDSSLRERLETVLKRAWDDGSPVAGSSPKDWQAIAAIALRRVRSYSRRRTSNDRGQRINDLAKGLISKFESDPKLVGRLIQDYRWLAARLLEAIDSVDAVE